MAKKSGSLKSTLAVSLNNYLDAGAIVAGSSGITLWQNYLGLSEMHLGWLNALSANALGAAIGAIIGGFLADRFGRKFIFTYKTAVAISVSPRCHGVSALCSFSFSVCFSHLEMMLILTGLYTAW